MDVLGQTLIHVINSTHYNTETKVHFCVMLFKHFLKAYSQVTFTETVLFSGLPKPLYAVQV